MFIPKSRLTAEVARWQASGWIDERGAAAIRADLAARDTRTGPFAAFAVLGALLLAAAGISFVAAHWDDMSKLLRLSLLGGGIAASYLVADALFRRGLDLFGHAAVVAGVGLFGAAIMLVAQMYHMDGDPPDAVWLWALGALAAGLLLRSNPALGVAIVLIGIWTVMVTMQGYTRVHWGYLPMWAVAAGGVAITRWRTGMHLLAISLSGWIVLSCLDVDNDRGRFMLTAIGLLIALSAVFAGEQIDRWRRISGTMLSHGIVQAFIGLLAVQFQPHDGLWSRIQTNLWLWGAVTLALLCGAMVASWRADNARVLRLTYALFAIEVFALYIAKIGTLLGTSAFFFLAGVLLIALATVAHRLGLTRRPPAPGASLGARP